MKFLTFLISLIASNFLIAQTMDQTVPVSFIVIEETSNYKAALKKAQLASNKLGLTLNLRNYYKDKELGLATSEVCGCGENHGYLARGRYDDGNYISIEYGKGYDSIQNNKYIIIVSSGYKTDVEAQLANTKRFYKRASIINERVYMGCMH